MLNYALLSNLCREDEYNQSAKHHTYCMFHLPSLVISGPQVLWLPLHFLTERYIYELAVALS